MDVRDNEKHERVISVYLTRGELEAVIENAIAEKTGIPLAVLREHGKLKIEANMEGSPEYQSGYKASLKATIPLPAPAILQEKEAVGDPPAKIAEEWAPTCHLRWLLNPTPGERDELQQLWTRLSPHEGYGPEQEWRFVDREAAF